MALIKCPECGKEISDTATTCPHCGTKTNYQKKKSGWFALGLIIFIIGILLRIMASQM